MKNILPYLFLILLFCQCKSGVEIDAIDINRLYAVTSFISPQDSLLKVYVYRGQAIGSYLRTDSSVVTDANVSISGKKLAFNTKTERYEVLNVGSNRIQAGQSYQLDVRLKDGTTVTGTCSIPANAPNVENMTGQKKGDDYDFGMAWQANVPNAYVMFSYEAIFERKLSIGGNYPYLSLPVSSIKFPAKVSANTRISSNGTMRYVDDTERCLLKFYLSNLNQPMYQYLQSYANYTSWASNTGGGLIPNFREPQPLYTNLTGGVGVFGGFNQKVLELRVR